ncbi:MULTISPECIES: hypothetical protein [unclassified Synechocystis]|uniref:hypothetical protein n=1 Tax=unclassified Synechocystis TaxID=2640012 RepID=UPI00040E3C6E|nr:MULTISPECIES: hypothetical protein [unclassified Synechocystis]AIE75108.1 hypothetical protein D082_25790 [Synechocystis sp. PCC 6714]MCT0253194.1 hypothetical protein [Synechocystis sp. CS-94]
MLGNFQQSQLRIEVEATAPIIRDSLIKIPQLRQWLAPLPLGEGLPERLAPDVILHTGIGYAKLTQTVDRVGEDHLRLLLSGAIDGFHEWYWGDGWIQSRLEGISPLPLNLGQTLSLLKLRQFVTSVRSPAV